MVRQQDLDQSQRCYTYDPLDDVVAVDFLPGTEGEPVAPLSHQFQRDPVGRLVSKVTSDGTTITITGATWESDPATTRNLRIPLGALPAGLWSLRLVIDDEPDLFLGNVYIQ